MPTVAVIVEQKVSAIDVDFGAFGHSAPETTKTDVDQMSFTEPVATETKDPNSPEAVMDDIDAALESSDDWGGGGFNQDPAQDESNFPDPVSDYKPNMET